MPAVPAVYTKMADRDARMTSALQRRAPFANSGRAAFGTPPRGGSKGRFAGQEVAFGGANDPHQRGVLEAAWAEGARAQWNSRETAPHARAEDYRTSNPMGLEFVFDQHMYRHDTPQSNDFSDGRELFAHSQVHGTPANDGGLYSSDLGLDAEQVYRIAHDPLYHYQPEKEAIHVAQQPARHGPRVMTSDLWSSRNPLSALVGGVSSAWNWMAGMATSSARAAVAPPAAQAARPCGCARMAADPAGDAVFRAQTRRSRAHAAVRGATGSAAGSAARSSDVRAVGRW